MTKLDTFANTLHDWPYFPFPNVLKRWYSQKIALECDLSCFIRKDNIFLENMILFFRQKMKDNLSGKSTSGCDIFCKFSGKMVFPKKIAMEYDLSCIIRRDDISSSKNMILFFRRKIKDHISQNNTWKYFFLKKALCP